MATGFNPLGAAAYSNTPKIAIVQPAKDWRFYENSIMTLDTSKGALLKEYKESGVWKDHYKTWRDACIPLEMSSRQADRIIAQEIFIKSEVPTESPEQKKQTLKAIAALPDPPKMEEPEKPHIRTKDEIEAEQAEQAKPAPRKATENGKPKSELAVWSKGMDCGGAFLRAVDEINRFCPNKPIHDRAISEIQGVMRLIDTWRTKGC